MLTRKENRYFDAMKTYILNLFNLKVPVYPLDHKTFIVGDTEGDILGCCHKVKNEEGEVVLYVITIDETYIRACFYGRQTTYSPYSDNQLIETICHEIAHLYLWEHGKDHTALTNELYDTVIASLNNSNKFLNLSNKTIDIIQQT